MNNFFRKSIGMSACLSNPKLWLAVFFICFSLSFSSCTLIGKQKKRGTVKVVKPINRYGYYNAKKHKRAKRTKIVKMYN